MKKIKIVPIIIATLLLTGCSTTNINQNTTIGEPLMTGETMTGAGESGAINTDNISGTEIGGKTTTGETITGTAIIDSPATIAQENELKEKIKTLIEKRKIDSKPATKLTEEDIQLMTDVLQTIVDETKSK